VFRSSGVKPRVPELAHCKTCIDYCIFVSIRYHQEEKGSFGVSLFTWLLEFCKTSRPKRGMPAGAGCTTRSGGTLLAYYFCLLSYRNKRVVSKQIKINSKGQDSEGYLLYERRGDKTSVLLASIWCGGINLRGGFRISLVSWTAERWICLDEPWKTAILELFSTTNEIGLWRK
jgi:hypothetical protein